MLGRAREGTVGASSPPGLEKVASALRAELTVSAGGTSRYRRQSVPRPGEIQVVPRIFDSP